MFKIVCGATGIVVSAGSGRRFVGLLRGRKGGGCEGSMFKIFCGSIGIVVPAGGRRRFVLIGGGGEQFRFIGGPPGIVCP
jgi:hypothetical protein